MKEPKRNTPRRELCDVCSFNLSLFCGQFYKLTVNTRKASGSASNCRKVCQRPTTLYRAAQRRFQAKWLTEQGALYG